MSKKAHDSIRYQEEDVKHAISTWLIKNGIDLIRWKDNIVLVEVKNAESYSGVYDSFFQLLRYYNNISAATADNKRLDITGFIAATQYSIQGHLFSKEPLETYESFGDGRKYAASEGFLPYSEYKMTEMFIRLLWRAKQKPDVFIGALLSSVLNFPRGDAIPTILAKQNGQQIFKEVRA